MLRRLTWRAASIALTTAGVSSYALCTGARTPADVIIEHRTGHTFPLTRGSGESLLGVNTRCMLGWCRLSIARAYAFGLFADEAALREGASAPPGKPRLDALLDGAEAGIGVVSLVLVIARSIEGDHLAHGFRNSVLNRYKKLIKSSVAVPDRAQALASGRAASGLPAVAVAVVNTAAITTSATATATATAAAGPLAELSDLCSAFSKHFFQIGDEAILEWRGGVVTLLINGKVVPGAELRDGKLARALFDVYAGDAPVSARAKTTFEANLNSLAAFMEGGGRDRLTAVLPEIVMREHATRTK